MNKMPCYVGGVFNKVVLSSELKAMGADSEFLKKLGGGHGNGELTLSRSI